VIGALIGALVDAFVPTIGLIAFGHVLRRRNWLGAAFWADAERLVFYVFLPALLVVATATVDLARLPVAALTLTIWLVVLLGTLLALGLGRLFRLDWTARTSVVQGSIRFNNLVGFALAGPLFGAEGIALGGVVVGIMVPFINTVTVAVFAAGGRSFSVPGFLWQLARNPMVVSCLAGFALNLSGIGLPPGLGPMLRALGQGAVALGLMAVGAALAIGTLSQRLPLQAGVGAIKLLIVPALVWMLGPALGLNGLPLSIAVLFMALPTSSASYIMARQMGGDAPLMAAVTTSEHLAAMVTLPLVIALVGRT
jgi:malonate transporter